MATTTATLPGWVNVTKDDVCAKCNELLIKGVDRGRYDKDAQEFIACNHCEPCDAAEPILTTTVDEAIAAMKPTPTPAAPAAAVNVLGNLVSAIESFARANGCADKVDLMLAAMIRAAK